MKKSLLPIHILILVLAFLTAWSTCMWNGTDLTAWLFSLRNIALLTFSGFAIRLLIRSFIDPGLTVRQEHRWITVMILFLLFDPLLPWWVFSILGAVTELSQYFIRTKLGPLFNPAALGGLLVSLFGYLPSWWGVNPAPRVNISGIEVSIIAWITALGAAYVIYRYRKLPIACAAFIALGLGYLALFQSNPSYLLLEGTLLFFIFVMVCEPKTSPVVRREQVIYGALVGLLFPVGLYFHFLEASFIALLIGNLYTGRDMLLLMVKTAQKPSASPLSPPLGS